MSFEVVVKICVLIAIVVALVMWVFGATQDAIYVMVLAVYMRLIAMDVKWNRKR